jgi:hypothetical protein
VSARPELPPGWTELVHGDGGEIEQWPDNPDAGRCIVYGPRRVYSRTLALARAWEIDGTHPWVEYADTLAAERDALKSELLDANTRAAGLEAERDHYRSTVNAMIIERDALRAEVERLTALLAETKGWVPHPEACSDYGMHMSPQDYADLDDLRKRLGLA